jgi:NtrC-family two-component system response regulator AlgB
MCLETMGCQVTTAGTAIVALEHERFDFAFLDLRLGQANGMDLLPRLIAARPELAVVVMTAHASIETAVQAIKRGAIDFLPKPFSPIQIWHVIEQIRIRQGMRRRAAEADSRLHDEPAEADFRDSISGRDRHLMPAASRAIGR